MPDSPALMPSAAALQASQTALLPTQACSFENMLAQALYGPHISSDILHFTIL